MNLLFSYQMVLAHATEIASLGLAMTGKRSIAMETTIYVSLRGTECQSNLAGIVKYGVIASLRSQ
jgi:hypothetical protein